MKKSTLITVKNGDSTNEAATLARLAIAHGCNPGQRVEVKSAPFFTNYGSGESEYNPNTKIILSESVEDFLGYIKTPEIWGRSLISIRSGVVTAIRMATKDE